MLVVTRHNLSKDAISPYDGGCNRCGPIGVRRWVTVKKDAHDAELRANERDSHMPLHADITTNPEQLMDGLRDGCYRQQCGTLLTYVE
jgi:hypothetical protein